MCFDCSITFNIDFSVRLSTWQCNEKPCKCRSIARSLDGVERIDSLSAHQ